ncbi:MAG: hypothetical protein RLZZ61_493 [Pseudomonadota bacterium]|jgi:hypothetical protein
MNLTGTDGFLIRGALASDNAGNSVANAGDVNGDGIADLIIGAMRVDRGGNNEAGAAYVVYGKASGGWGSLIDDPSLPGRKILDLANLQAADVFRILGPTTGFLFGTNVSGVGDVNNDGFADVAIGTNAQSAYIVFGFGTTNPQGTVTSGIRTLDATALTATQGFRMTGTNSFGQITGPAGDVNGDGIADIMIGAPYNDSFGRSLAGEVYIVYGKAAGTGAFGQLVGGGQVLSTANLGAGDGFVVQGRGGADRTGNMLSYNGYTAAGDVNGDGIDDIGIPIYSGDVGFGDAGNVTFLYGTTGRGGLSLTGTNAANTLVGGDLNDTIIGGGGADILLGLIGNDILTVADTNFARVDGGAGNDMLRLAGTAGLNLNLSTLAAGAIQGIEQIDLVAGSLNNTLTVTQQSLLDLSSTSDLLKVFGDSGDTVTATGFTTGSIQTENGITYNVYTNGSATLWVQQGVVVNTPAQSGFVAPAISWAEQAVLAG